MIRKIIWKESGNNREIINRELIWKKYGHNMEKYDNNREIIRKK